ncbi:MAG: DUF262 domain-containing protein [Trueperaceae bacterium]|nr:DUF262 domain-containing protein [Trueperaceae bacterium]
MAQKEPYSVETKTTEYVLYKDSAVYEVPKFQRKYAWTVKEVGELLYDLFDDANWDAEDFQNELPYFLGAIVVVSQNDQVESVLDGQQRLTTISLIIAILQQKLRDIDCDQSTIAKYNDFLWRTSRMRRDESQIRMKLHPEDATIYKTIINKPTSKTISQHRDSKIGSAAERILRDVQNEYLKLAHDKGVSEEDAIIYMLEKVIVHISFVKIIAPSESDAFRLFETLNDRGLALSAADLIKNKLLSRCSTSDKRNAVDKVVEIWTEVLELVGEEEITDFLRYFWIAFHGKVSKRLL